MPPQFPRSAKTETYKKNLVYVGLCGTGRMWELITLLAYPILLVAWEMFMWEPFLVRAGLAGGTKQVHAKSCL